MRLVLMGVPGVGKGTQALRLRDELGVVHLSTGDILREAIASGSPLGRRVRGYLDSGALVPDDLIGELIVDRLAKPDAAQGFILDGFPRTVPQVEILDRALQKIQVRLDGVVLLTAPQAEIVRRLTGRRVCPKDGEVYHIEHHPPRSAGVCDRCGSALVQRPDDTEEVIRKRLAVYEEETLPIAASYRERNLLHEIDGTGAPDEVFARLRSILVRT